MPRFVITSGAREGSTFPFERPIVIGRGGSADLSLPDHTVSRRHALVGPLGEGWMIEDLQTQNGTVVNGVRISQPTVLRPGYVVQVGAVAMEYLEPPPAREPLKDSGRVALVERGETSRSVILRLDASGSWLAKSSESAEKRLDALQKRLDLLADLSTTLVGHSFDESALLERILDRLLEILPQADRAFILFCDPRGRPVPKATRTRSQDGAPAMLSRTLVRDLIEARQAILSQDTAGDRRFDAAASLHGLQLRSLIGVPIIVKDEVYGAIVVDSTRAGLPFGETDLEVLLGVARQLGLFLANARLHSRLLAQELLERDLALARKVQQGFLPRNAPSVPGYSFAVEYSPALAVGGDFYSFLDLPDDWVGVAVGDVSGKGVSAALYVARLSSDLRYHSVGEVEPAVILKRVNHSLAGTTEEGMFVTATLVCLNPRTGQLKVSSAGHMPPLVREAKGAVVPLGEGGGSPLGVGANAIYDQHTYALEPTDIVVLYTDGLNEAMNREHRQFGDERLAAAVRRAPHSVRGVLETVLRDVRSFEDGEPPHDDLTLVCFGRPA